MCDVDGKMLCWWKDDMLMGSEESTYKSGKRIGRVCGLSKFRANQRLTISRR